MFEGFIALFQLTCGFVPNKTAPDMLDSVCAIQVCRTQEEVVLPMVRQLERDGVKIKMFIRECE